MATPTNDVSIRGMRETHFEQLQSYIEWAEESGVYYGQKRYFDKRHEEIKEWVDSIIRAFIREKE